MLTAKRLDYKKIFNKAHHIISHQTCIHHTNLCYEVTSIKTIVTTCLYFNVITTVTIKSRTTETITYSNNQDLHNWNSQSQNTMRTTLSLCNLLPFAITSQLTHLDVRFINKNRLVCTIQRGTDKNSIKHNLLTTLRIKKNLKWRRVVKQKMLIVIISTTIGMGKLLIREVVLIIRCILILSWVWVS